MAQYGWAKNSRGICDGCSDVVGHEWYRYPLKVGLGRRAVVHVALGRREFAPVVSSHVATSGWVTHGLRSAQAQPAVQCLIQLHQMQGFQLADYLANGYSRHAEEFVGHQLRRLDQAIVLEGLTGKRINGASTRVLVIGQRVTLG